MSQQRSDTDQQVLTCIEDLQPITAEDVVTYTGWNRHVVDLTIAALIKAGRVELNSQQIEGHDPLYSALEP